MSPRPAGGKPQTDGRPGARIFGVLTDPTGNYLRDANGNVISSCTGVNRIPTPVLREPATIDGVSNAIAVSRLPLLVRRQNVKQEHLRRLPKINASYTLRENPIGPVSCYCSVGRPDFNPYAGGLTLPDTELPPNTANHCIPVNNTGIKTWSAKTTKVRFEFDFERAGPSTPAHAQFRPREDFGSLWTFGVKATF